MDTFVGGVGESNIIIMCMIYLLAGGFSAVASAMGGVDSTVNFGLSVIPPSLILPGMFVIAAFVATAMGTSMGTIGAVAPIAVEMAVKAHLPVAVAVGAVVGGAMFGDNLSMISDTTIAATRTQGCEMRDKFIMNFKIALPAAILTIIVMIIFGVSGQIPDELKYSVIRILPYISVLVLAFPGERLLVLIVGAVSRRSDRICQGSFTL